jgi:amino acid permease
LGENWGRFALAALAASLWGAMVAYMIVGGTFLKTIFSPVIGGSEFGYALVMALTAGLVMYRGIQFVSRFATVIVGILVFLFLFIILAALPHAEVSNLAGVHWEKFLLPYGVALFALSGMGIVPELKAVLGKRADRHLPCAVVVGMAVITALYLVFGLTVAAVLGPDTTAAAFDGLVPVLGSSFGVIAALLGSVTILSIFTIVGIELTNTFRYDFHVDPRAATLLAVGVPVVLFVAGIRELIEVLSFVGGVFGGALGILIVAMYEKTRPGPVRVTSWFVALVFAVGIIFTIVNSL